MGNSDRRKARHDQAQAEVRTPTPRGKASEEDTTETPMWVNKGGKLTILQEDQGNLFTWAGIRMQSYGRHSRPRLTCF
jgi:hypothetical protein